MSVASHSIAHHPTHSVTPREIPQNGIAGLKHWRQDILAGMVVSLISLPFSLGIAVASGAPPITGITSAIIAGFILPFLGGSYVTISGPAAGLAPILLASMMVLGRGNLETGYPILLVAICFTGCLQLVLAKLKLARLSAIFPTAVVEGMLCSIGLLIIVKQFPFLMGVKFHAHEFIEYVTEVPSHFAEMQPTVFLIGILSLAVMFALSACKATWLKVVPPQVIAVVFGSALGMIFGLSGSALIHIPENPLAHGITMPHFQGVWNDSSLWVAVATTVITLTMIDGIESLATVIAIDKIDPFHRKSEPNRTLFAMGVSNIVSSLAGGLTIIPGGVKSTACIMSGGRTQWANFYNACFLLVYLLLARPIINLMPYGVLAAMLIFTGYKLCRPKVWMHIAHIGWEQLAVFTITVVATLSTDLLWGIITGISAKWLLASWMHLTAPRVPGVAETSNSGGAWPSNGHVEPSKLAKLLQPFRSPVARRESVADSHHIFFEGPLCCFNLLHVNNELERTPQTAKRVVLHLTEHVTVVDHTSCERLLHYVEECHRNGTASVELVGLDQMTPRSAFPTCMRTRRGQSTDTSGGHHRDGQQRRPGAAAKNQNESVLCRSVPTTAVGNQIDPDNSLTWLSLSDPAITAAGDLAAPHDLAAEARADMDWLDLEVASGQSRRKRDPATEARADMDWLDLKRDSSGPAFPIPGWNPT
jgi:carbonic anhydrase